MIPTDALNGLKVLELGQLTAGPFAGKTLAEFGADVLRKVCTTRREVPFEVN